MYLNFIYFHKAVPPIAETNEEQCSDTYKNCISLRCPYGIEAYVDENNCNQCRCTDPCQSIQCEENTRCTIDINTKRENASDPQYISICREGNIEYQIVL